MYKDKVHIAVTQYKRLFKAEYLAVVEQINEKRRQLDDPKFGMVKNDIDSVDRILAEYPETLYHAIIQLLTIEEIKEFQTLKGQRWFAKTFKEFRLPEKI